METITLPKRRKFPRGVCWSCTARDKLYPAGTAVGVKMVCADCSRMYGHSPGYTHDGLRVGMPTRGGA